MKVNNARIVLTGACGGIGHAIATKLAKQGAHLLLVDLDSEKLLSLQYALKTTSANVYTLSADLCSNDSYESVIQYATRQMGHIDILINGAGIMSYTEFHQQDPLMVERTFKINVIAPMQLANLCLPDMLARRQGQIVNIGSVFGSIGFAYFSSYSASKFALRGFTESLRRELADSGVQLTYIAPRAVKTPLNSPAVYTMAEKVNMNMDPPEWVADKIVEAIEADRKDVYLGFPESLFVRINAIFPRLVDMALRKQNRIMHDCLEQP